jgi:hypothetical protein
MPKRVTPDLNLFVRRLLAHEAALVKLAPGKGSAAFRVSEKLRKTLVILMGHGGVRALFSRSLALAGSDVPWLRVLEVNDEGSFQGLGGPEAKRDGNEIALGETALVRRLIELLVTFIGPAMTLQLIQSEWPQAKFDDSDLEK